MVGSQAAGHAFTETAARWCSSAVTTHPVRETLSSNVFFIEGLDVHVDQVDGNAFSSQLAGGEDGVPDEVAIGDEGDIASGHDLPCLSDDERRIGGGDHGHLGTAETEVDGAMVCAATACVAFRVCS